MPLRVRKAVILLCRSRRNPLHDRLAATTLWRITEPLWTFLDKLQLTKSFSLCLDGIFESRLTSGLLLSLTLSMPYTNDEIREIKTEMIRKEVGAMERSRRDSTIQWGRIMSDPEYQIDGRIRHPRISRSLSKQIASWALEVSSRTLYPHSGRKMLAGRCAYTIETSGVVPHERMSSSMAEWWYGRTGSKGSGPCEMKQRWYPTNATPRTYFAQGLDAYHSSKYLRNIFNQLGDRFRNMNRFTRVLPQLVIPDDLEDLELYIYDLTAFTSLFHEHRTFLLDLADLLEDVDVVIADSWKGRCVTTLSSMIREYVSVNISNPSYVASVLDPTLLVEFTHNVAGFLGVYANLITCTIPHAIALSTLTDSFTSNWCAGDDAGILMRKSKKVVLDSILDRLGEIAKEKVFIGSEPGSVALKRSASLEHGMVLFRNSVVWPVFSLLFGDERFPIDEDKDVRATFCSGLIPFFQSCLRVVLNADDLEITLRVLRFVYSRLGLPTEGWFPVLTGMYPFSFTIPIIDERIFDLDPLERLVDLFYSTTYMCPVREFKVADKDDLIFQGSTEGNLTDWVRWCSTLGYITYEEVREEYTGFDGYLRVRDSVRRKNSRLFKEPIVYVIRLVDDLPSHVRHLCDL